MSKYPELDASIEAGDELDAWKEKCHALEAENAQQLELLLEANALIIKRLKLDEHLEAENKRLRGLLPDAEQRIAELHEEYEGRHYKTCMYYVKFIINLRKENAVLRSLLPDAKTLLAGDRLGAVVTNTIITPDDYADLAMIRKWLNKLERP